MYINIALNGLGYVEPVVSVYDKGCWFHPVDYLLLAPRHDFISAFFWLRPERLSEPRLDKSGVSSP